MHETAGSDTIHRPSGSPAEQCQRILLNELKAHGILPHQRLQQTAHDPTVVESTVTLRDLAKQEFTKLRNAIHQAGQASNNAKIHETSDQNQTGRYAAELADRRSGKPATRFINKARVVQDFLGMHQDAIQAEAYIRAFLKKSTARGRICRRNAWSTPTPASREGQGKNAAAIAWALKARRESLG